MLLWILMLSVFSLFFVDWGRILSYLYNHVFVIALGVWVGQVAIPFLHKNPLAPPLNHPGPYLQRWTEAFLNNQHYLLFTLIITSAYILLLMSKPFYSLEPLFQKISEIQNASVLRWKQNINSHKRVTGQPHNLVPRAKPDKITPPKAQNDWWTTWREQDRKKRMSRINQNVQQPMTDLTEQESLRMNGKVTRQKLGQRFPIDKNALDRIIGMEEPLDAIKTAIEIPLNAQKEARKYNYEGFSGMILYGPPGNGKTALARAVAQTFGLYFIAIQPSSLLGTLVGATEQHIRNAFLEAQENAPAIVFFDEIDAIGKIRGSSNSNHLDTALNELLIALDGFNSRKKVFVMAATNRIDIIDPALLRPGRFDKKIYVPNPTKEELALMFWTWTRDLPLSDAVYPRELTDLMEGASGADVRGWADKIRELAVKKAYTRKAEIILRDEVKEIIKKYPPANRINVPQ